MSASFDPQNEAEFDRYANSYDAMHRASIKASGEDPDYFARNKRDVLVRLVSASRDPKRVRVLDFGCGIGNLTTHLVSSFGTVTGFDPSEKSVTLARERVPGAAFVDALAELERDHFDAIVVANVLHHVKPNERDALLASLVPLLSAGGALYVFEHNPRNPLTQKAVRDCPFDEDAVLLSSRETRARLAGAGLAGVDLEYIVFFPRSLAPLRPLEPRLAWLPLGAQYVAWGARA